MGRRGGDLNSSKTSVSYIFMLVCAATKRRRWEDIIFPKDTVHDPFNCCGYDY